MPMSNPLWALLPEAAETLLPALARETHPPQEPSALHAAILPQRGQVADKGYSVTNGVAVIPIKGSIFQHAIYSQWDGRKLACGQDEIAAALATAINDPSTKAILFAIDSPGGTVSGTKELADKIVEAAKRKPMASYADGLMASAAMWLGAATGRVYAPITALVGSVGIIMTCVDYSKLNEKMGISINYITGGKFKSAGYSDQPLSDEARALFEKQVGELHEIFKADVVRGLGITAPASQWAEGQTMLAGEAKNVGLVTHIVRDLESAITQLSQEATMDYATLSAKHPELLAEITAKARAEAAQEQDANAKAAAKAATDSVLAMVKTVAGEDVHAKLAGLVAANVQPETLAAVTAILGASAVKEEKTELSAEEAARARILAGIEAAANKTVEGRHAASPEAETQAAIDRMAKLS